MGVELKQGSKEASPSAAFVGDYKGSRILHMQENARIKTTIMGVITQTSPGVIVGLGGDTTMSLPGGAVPTDVRFFGKANAQATSATISLGLDTTTNYFLSSQAVSTPTNGQGQQLPAGATNLFLSLATLPVGHAHSVTGFYSETVTSVGGGPWYVEIDYYLPDPA